MMAEKAKLMGDESTRQMILQAKDNPRRQQALGKQVDPWNENLWIANREEIVFKGNLAKFTQNAELKAFLLSSDDAVIAEASPADKIWGIGMKRIDPRAMNELEWEGSNLLGKALMRAREHIKQE